MCVREQKEERANTNGIMFNKPGKWRDMVFLVLFSLRLFPQGRVTGSIGEMQGPLAEWAAYHTPQ